MRHFFIGLVLGLATTAFAADRATIQVKNVGGNDVFEINPGATQGVLVSGSLEVASSITIQGADVGSQLEKHTADMEAANIKIATLEATVNALKDALAQLTATVTSEAAALDDAKGVAVDLAATVGKNTEAAATNADDVKTNAAAVAENAAAVQSLENSPTHYETVVNVTVTEGAWVPLGYTTHPAPFQVDVGVVDAGKERAFQLTVARDGELARGDPIFACAPSCVFVDADDGDNGSGHGTAEKPWKTLAYAQKNADADVTGVVVRGAFDVAKGFVFAPGWSYTGFGTATVFDNKGGELAVKMNSFYRLVFDFNGANDGATFVGQNAEFHNVVIARHHSTDGGRELLYPKEGTADDCSLVLNYVTFVDVEYNHLAYSHECETVKGTVVADSDPKRFDLSDTEVVTITEVDVAETSYFIESGENNAELGVYAGKWSFAEAEGPSPRGVSAFISGGDKFGVHDRLRTEAKVDVMYRRVDQKDSTLDGIFWYLRLLPHFVDEGNCTTKESSPCVEQGEVFVSVAAVPGLANTEDEDLEKNVGNYYAARKYDHLGDVPVALVEAGVASPGCDTFSGSGECQKCAPIETALMTDIVEGQLSYSGGWGSCMPGSYSNAGVLGLTGDSLTNGEYYFCDNQARPGDFWQLKFTDATEVVSIGVSTQCQSWDPPMPVLELAYCDPTSSVGCNQMAQYTKTGVSFEPVFPCTHSRTPPAFHLGAHQFWRLVTTRSAHDSGQGFGTNFGALRAWKKTYASPDGIKTNVHELKLKGYMVSTSAGWYNCINKGTNMDEVVGAGGEAAINNQHRFHDNCQRKNDWWQVTFDNPTYIDSLGIGTNDGFDPPAPELELRYCDITADTNCIDLDNYTPTGRKVRVNGGSKMWRTEAYKGDPHRFWRLVTTEQRTDEGFGTNYGSFRAFGAYTTKPQPNAVHQVCA